jgi:hypothetical protein
VATTAFVQAANVWHKTGSTLSPVTGGDLVAPAALPAATVAALGAIKVGTGLSVAGDGTLKVNLTGALIFKGAKDPTAVAPTGPATGDVYVMTQAGTMHASWVGIGGSVVSIHEAVAFDGTEWIVMGSVGAAAVTAITTTAPLQKTGTSSVALTIDSASEAAKGVVELATAAETTAGTDAARAVHPAGLKVELDKKAPLASPALTGAPTAPTAAAGTNTTQLATTAFVRAADKWTRTGTTLSPSTAGDTIQGQLVPTNGALGSRNVIINGELKINQRGVTIAAAAVGAYGPDRWKKVDASHMTQIIEDVNFVPGAKYTLSWKGGTPQVLTAPASGHWTLPNIPITATEVQLETGEVATPYERRSYVLEELICQRYYQSTFVGYGAVVYFTSSGANHHCYHHLSPHRMRVAPTVNNASQTVQLQMYPQPAGPSNSSSVAVVTSAAVTDRGVFLEIPWSGNAAGLVCVMTFPAALLLNAEL